MEIVTENILLAFLIFMIIGWVIELAYRSYEAKNFVNPGFLRGPYTPIYGFGGLAAYFITYYSEELSIVGSIIVFLFSVTTLEYLTSLFFEKTFKIKLWDYSDRKFNLQGRICPTFIFYWLFLGAFFKYGLFPYFDKLMQEVTIGGSQIFFLGMVYGVFSVDLVESFGLAYKIKKAINEFGEEHISPKVFALRSIYEKVGRELNREIKADEKVSQIKEKGLLFTNYFRLRRNVGSRIRETVKEKVEELKNNQKA